MQQLVKDLAEQNKKLVGRLKAKSKEVPNMEKMLKQLADRNAVLESRLEAFEASDADTSSEADASPEASPAPTPRRRSPRRKTPVAPKHIRTDSPRRKTPVAPKPTRRSPRKRRTPEASDSSSENEEGGEPLRRRLSAELSTPKRKPKPEIIRDVRKTVGEILFLNMDDKITSGYYLNSKRFFKLRLFEDDTRAMVDYLHSSAEINTGKLTKLDIFKLAVQVAKKRERYTPAPKKAGKHEHAKKKSPYAGKNHQIKLNARAVYNAIVASTNLRRLSHVSPAVVSASAAAASRSAATALASAAAAADPAAVTDAEVNRMFESSGDEKVAELEKYNHACQEKRTLAKKELAKAKAAEVELAKAKAAKKAKAAEAKAAKKAKAAEAKAAKQAKAAKAKAAAKKAKAAKKQAAKQDTLISRNKADCLFTIGGAVCGFWTNNDSNDDGDANDAEDGGWYEGVVVSINYAKRTIHIKYDDQDEDFDLSWDLARILDG